AGVFLFNQNVDVLIQKQNQLAAQIQATQPIFAPQAIYGIAAARAGERLATDNVEQARQDILFGVTQAYYSAAGLKQVVAVNERQLAIARDHERDAKVRFDAGAAPKVTLLRAEIDRARAEQDLKRAQNSYLGAKVAISTLLDRREADFEVEVPPPPQVPGDQAVLEEGAARDRFDVLATGEQVTVAQKNRDATVATYLPTLGAFGRYQYSNAAGFTGETTTWAIGLALNWNLFDGGLREATLRENEARVAEANAVRGATLARARDEVLRTRLDLDSALANRLKAKEQVDLARENQRLVDVNYKAGAATYIEVSDANTALLNAELSQVSEELNADLAAVRLLKAAGAFTAR
ncbi:MAG: TolC family protein, partial [Anaeromyxobacteraceae bacterium]